MGTPKRKYGPNRKQNPQDQPDNQYDQGRYNIQEDDQNKDNEDKEDEESADEEIIDFTDPDGEKTSTDETAP